MDDSKKLVLIVDDFKDTREMYLQYLTQQGLNVSTAADGASAYAQSVQLLPNLILMDLSLPDMSGGEVVRRLKANPKTQHIPVMALTAYGPEQMAGALAEAGFSGYLGKTTPLDQLLQEVQQALGGPADGAAAQATERMAPKTTKDIASKVSSERPAQSPAEKAKLVLIAEDTADDREMYEHFLVDKGFRVESAGDGKAALAKAIQLIPDVVVMDLSLPLMSGWEVTAQLKNDSRTRHIPVVILTAHAHDGVATVIKSGCEGFLIKPCLPTALHKEIVRVLGRSSQAGGAVPNPLRAATS